MRKQELRFILQEMEKERNNNDFSLFRRIYTSEKRLNELCQNPVIRKKFNLSPPDFSDSVAFGLYSLFKIQKDKQINRSRNGGIKKKDKYKPYFDFVQAEYEALRQKRKSISDRRAASLIYEKLFTSYKHCPLTVSNGEETVRKWIAKIRKAD
ncbi:MAG: hypothetical protein J6L82_04405 [Alphaproteobacteria bacterium]|nr:hypothetical protein [Oscillospiraceae bacterium]MBP3403133.1 hypothetical protein [Alphaproteobacteria bacterium]